MAPVISVDEEHLAVVVRHDHDAWRNDHQGWFRFEHHRRHVDVDPNAHTYLREHGQEESKQYGCRQHGPHSNIRGATAGRGIRHGGVMS
jgi:hypothetical protein